MTSGALVVHRICAVRRERPAHRLCRARRERRLRRARRRADCRGARDRGARVRVDQVREAHVSARLRHIGRDLQSRLKEFFDTPLERRDTARAAAGGARRARKKDAAGGPRPPGIPLRPGRRPDRAAGGGCSCDRRDLRRPRAAPERTAGGAQVRIARSDRRAGQRRNHRRRRGDDLPVLTVECFSDRPQRPRPGPPDPARRSRSPSSRGNAPRPSTFSRSR